MQPSLSSINTGDDRSRYTPGIGKFRVLGAKAEQTLCQRWRDHHDISAAHQLTGSYLRLVVKIALDYRGYGLASEELIGEGYVGLMHAVCRFDLDRGVGFAAYAAWWVRATILECILRNKSLANTGTTASQRRLFLSLRSMHGRLREFTDGTRKSEHASSMASLRRLRKDEVISINPPTPSTDRSPNTLVSVDSLSGWRTWLVDDDDSDQATVLAECKEIVQWRSLYSPH